MSIFKNRLTGDIVTAYGVIHDHFAARPDHEIVTDDRDGTADTAPQPEVLADEPANAEGSEPSPSQDDPNPADDASDNSRSIQ